MSALSLEAAPSYEEFLHAPLGRFFLDRQLLAWAASPTLIGFTFWGTAGQAEIDSLNRPFDLPIPETIAKKTNVLVDVRFVESIDGFTFDQFLRLSQGRLPDYERRIARQAIVRPSGMIGALAEGLINLIGPSYGVRVVDSMDAALQWLGESAMRETVRRLEQRVAEARAQPPALTQLREWIATHLADPEIDHAARALGMSRRSLQRLLAAAATSFREEREHRLTTEAIRLLRETDEKIERVAQRLGFATTSSFSVFLRRRTGHSPAQARGGAER